MPERLGLADDLAPDPDDVDGRAVATLRMLAVDMVESAGSGHPGLPLGAAPMAWALWSRFLRVDPTMPDWPDRDRFVLSAGHGSALLYALLHVFGFGLTTDDLRAFRQVGSRTPGHPEYGHTPGVEVTTGPLGQGIATAVGLALAERLAGERFNTDTPAVVDHRTFVLCSDGDLMEGVSGEASSLAGHLGLGRLVVLWDDNRISIDGSTDLAFGEDVSGRYRAYGWQVLDVDDGNDVDAIAAAIDTGLCDAHRPSFIRVRTTIGYGAPTLEGTPGVHGAPLGAAEATGLRTRLGWPAETFHVPDDVRARVQAIVDARVVRRGTWQERFDRWALAEPRLVAEWCAGRDRVTGPAFDALAAVAFDPDTPIATRTAGGKALDAITGVAPFVVGGSADLAGSTNVRLPEPRRIHFGVREHAMAAVLNGLALHGDSLPVGSTFLVFSDYCRPALRLAALMNLGVVHVYTHDSIGLGEDGPTHQPVEHLAAMRAIPGVAVLRPADAHETVEAWRIALARSTGPTVLALSRQALPILSRGPTGWMADVGARVLRPAVRPTVALVATGSEVALALDSAGALVAAGHDPIVVSMPWRERFLSLDGGDRHRVLPAGVPVVVVEAGSPSGWHEVTTAPVRVVGLDRFGRSGKGPDVQEALGFTVDHIVGLVDRLAAPVRSTEPSGVAG